MSRFFGYRCTFLLAVTAVMLFGLNGVPVAAQENNSTPSDQLADLYAKAAAAYQQQDTAKAFQLLGNIFAFADRNHLGADPSFAQSVNLIYVVTDPKQKLEFLESALRISVRDNPEAEPRGLCGQMIGLEMPAWMNGAPGTVSIEELERRNPACKELFDNIRPRLNAALSVGKGDYSGMLANLKKRFEEARASGGQDNDINPAGLVFFSLLSGDIPGAREYVLQLEDDLQHLESEKPSSLPGLPELQQFQNSTAGSGYRDSSLAAFYHLRFAPKDSALKQNAMQLLLSAKNKELDDAQATIRFLRTSSPSNSQLAKQMIAEYANSAGLWAQANIDRTPITPTMEQDAIKRMETLQDGMKSIYSNDLTSHSEKQAPRITEVAQRLGKDDALVEFAEVWWPDYHAGTKPPIDLKAMGSQVHYVAYVLRHDGSVFAVDLGDSATINTAIAAFRSSMSPSAEGGRDSARQLYDLLWKPLLATLPPPGSNSGHVYISPDANLSLLPFDALLADDKRHLLELWDTSYLTSGRQLAEWVQDSAGTTSTVVFANPDFSLAAGKDRSTGLAREYKRLPRTQLEAQAIKLTLPNVTLFTGANASKSALESTSNPSILHLATHGYYLDPPKSSSSDKSFDALTKKEKFGFLRSGLILSSGDQSTAKEQDRVVTSLEIAMLDLNKTKLVVLSACDSGVGDTTVGDNVSGLRSAFQMAGTKALISSLWTVNDQVGEAFIEDFYKNLAGSGKGGVLSINQSLRQAKLSMLTKEPNPYYWASFVFEGKDQTLRF